MDRRRVRRLDGDDSREAAELSTALLILEAERLRKSNQKHNVIGIPNELHSIYKKEFV